MTPPTCKYVLNGLQCRNGDQCKYAHESSQTAERVACKYNFENKCKYGAACWNKHETRAESGLKDNRFKRVCHFYHGPHGCRNGAACPFKHQTLECVVCQESVAEKTRLGLMVECTHIVCQPCITKWRKSPTASYASRKGCPACRTISPYVMPCNQYTLAEKKGRLKKQYLKACAETECRNYKQNRKCFFGRDCHFAHFNDRKEDVKASGPPMKNNNLFSDQGTANGILAGFDLAALLAQVGEVYADEFF